MYQQQQSHELDARSRSRAVRFNKSQEFTSVVDSHSYNNSHSTISHCKISQFHLNVDIFYREKLHHSLFKAKTRIKTLVVHINSLFTREGFAIACSLAKYCKQIQIRVDGGSPLALTTEFFHRIFKQRKPKSQEATVILKLNSMLSSSSLSKELSRALMSRKIKECIVSQIYCYDTTQFTTFLESVRGIQKLQGFHIFLSRMNSDLSLSLSSGLLPQLKSIENITLSLCRVVAPTNRSLIAESFWSSLSQLHTLRYLNLDFYNSYDTYYSEGALQKALSSLHQLEELVLEFTYDSSLMKDFTSELGGLIPVVSKLKEFRMVLSIFSIDSENSLIEFFSMLGADGFGILKDPYQIEKINLHGLLKLEIGFKNEHFFLKKIEAEHWSEAVLDRIVPKLCEVAPELEHFEFTKNKIDEVPSEFLVSLEHSLLATKNLQKLALGLKATSLESRVNLIKLLKAIKSNSNLVALELDLISGWYGSTGSLLLTQISETLMHLTNLRTLWIELQDSMSEEPVNLTEISQAIKSLSKLESVRLRFGKIRIHEKQFIELMTCLSKCQKLSSLSLEIKVYGIHNIKDRIPSFLNSFPKLSMILIKFETRNYDEADERKLMKRIQKNLFCQETIDVIAIRVMPSQEGLHKFSTALINIDRSGEIIQDIQVPSNWI